MEKIANHNNAGQGFCRLERVQDEYLENWACYLDFCEASQVKSKILKICKSFYDLAPFFCM